MESFSPHKSISDPIALFKQPSRKTEDLSSLASASEHLENSPTPYQLAGLAKRLTECRSRRKEFMPPSLFGEPGWDILLALFNAESGGYRMTISGLCIASDAPATTALRWLATLNELGLVRRFQSPNDARVVFIQLQPAARVAIDAYLTSIWTTLFAVDQDHNAVAGESIFPAHLSRSTRSG